MTDDERREVAERLRELSGRMDTLGFNCLLAEAVRGYEFCETPCDECHRRLAAELAGLIEPSEPEVRCVAEVKVDGERLEELAHDAVVELTGIDRDELLALADEMDERAPYGWYSGERDSLRDYARRIREACGEVVR